MTDEKPWRNPVWIRLEAGGPVLALTLTGNRCPYRNGTASPETSGSVFRGAVPPAPDH